MDGGVAHRFVANVDADEDYAHETECGEEGEAVEVVEPVGGEGEHDAAEDERLQRHPRQQAGHLREYQG